ncbi:excinuclease ABC subunit UvrA [Stratiformator vulcanicus]|uniref:UvrABC system protein A n=1 Tax=Stratiformator vulcanicus TaxID=2527980 RepID=A0A517QZA0_9PLAN|nr:excinuclease ABC subunit UvrA [Stratiformator vulcanicus]QDT36977.1 UvrABC system protein A [Stratiformator vulcanicus]
MPASDIIIRGAREHNLQNVDLRLPKDQLIVMTGVSGSGKSSLAFDTLYAEGQRRYVESLSSYARQFLGQMPKPDVDSISGLAPSISIEQKTAGRNPRSTVGTITEIYDYLRVLFARVGQGYCYVSGLPIRAQTTEQIVDAIAALEDGTKYQILSPLIQNQKGEFRDLFEDLLKQGYLRARIDGEFYELTNPPKLRKHYKHNIELVIDRLVAGKANRSRLTEAVESALRMGERRLILVTEGGQSRGKGRDEKKKGEAHGSHPVGPEKLYSADYSCPESGMSYEPPSPQLFSFNSPLGMCHDCNGLGRRSDFVLDLLIPDPKKSVSRGAIELLGSFGKIGKWRKHLYKGAAEAIEEDLGMKGGTLLKTPWNKLSEEARDRFLNGTGDRHVTYTWRGWKHGGTWDGVISELAESYRSSSNPMRRRQLEKFMEWTTCSSCEGGRLSRQARNVRIKSNSESFQAHGLQPVGLELSLPQVCALSIEDIYDFFESLELDETRQHIAEEVLKEIRGRLSFLLRCGLHYLTLDRPAPTLSGGESQRIRLAGQIGCGLVGVVYILDEPSIGLHPRDNAMLLESLEDLRDQGNTVIVVEHDEETMRAADRVIDFGPGPGIRGGEIVVDGTVEDVLKNKKSLTGAYLSGRKVIEVPSERRKVGGASGKAKSGKRKAGKRKDDAPTPARPDARSLRITGATHNNLKAIEAEFPLGTFMCVTGVSGSGKSSLVNDILWQVLNRDVNGGNGDPGPHDVFEGIDLLDKAIDIDQSPIGRTPRSNPATYTKLFDEIRALYTKVPEAKVRGYGPGRFSFNVPGGRCEACEGYGATKLEMDFLADIWVQCPVCEGRRFNRETLEIEFKGKSIADVLAMDVQEALTHFEHVPKVNRFLKTLHDVGLDYIKLGQPSPTLSGGEAQRIKLSRELGKRTTGKTFYVLDEPTTGLHFADVHKLLDVLHSLVDQGNTVLVVEHNLDVIKTADWVIDLGPEGGAGGGRIVATGTPEEIAVCEESFTGRALRSVLDIGALGREGEKAKENGASALASPRNRWQIAPSTNGDSTKEITIRGARQHNLQDLDVTIPRNRMSVFSGPSGSGKSSLAMDTLYAEGQRRYVESLSAYARQFLGQMPKPKVEHVHGLSPAIAIEQKTVGSTPRSTVGTVTEIYDYLRILFARLGTPFCPDCEIPVGQSTTDEIVERVIGLEKAENGKRKADETSGMRALLMAPLVIHKGESFERLWEKLKADGYQRVRIDGETYSIDEVPDISHRGDHRVEVVVDRVTIDAKNRSRIADSIESALSVGRGVLRVAIADTEIAEPDWQVRRFSQHFACPQCDRSFEHLTPQNFSFNSPLGWCDACEGLGVETGTDRSVLVANENLSLREGAITAWPKPAENPLFARMLEAMAKTFGLDLDAPFYRLDPRKQRVVFYGSDREVTVPATKSEPAFGFTYKGLYPAMNEASRLSYHYRQKMRDMVGEMPCSACDGDRVRDDAAAFRFRDVTLPQLCKLPMGEAFEWLQNVKLKKAEKGVAGDLLDEATSRLRFLVDVGLEYLAMDRTMPSLSGGESQRIRLAGQIGRSLTGVLYVLDEPTIGLHPRDNGRLIGALAKLRDLGNTVVLVEHDREVIEASDRIYDFGPGAGRLGGQVTAEGTPKQVARKKSSLTGRYLADRASIPVPTVRRVGVGGSGREHAKEVRTDAPTHRHPLPEHDAGWLELTGCNHHNLRGVDLRVPLATLTCITGVSGSGKSSLIEGTLAPAVARRLNMAGDTPGPFGQLRGVEKIGKIIAVDQQPLGNTPASNPATYTGVFDQVRELFARLPDAKVRGYKPGRFSFNRPGGRCEDCEGLGQKKIEMHFLPDVWVECETCRGKRYNAETLAVQFRGRSISDVLEMPIGEAYELFENVPKIRSVLGVLCAIGLDYLTLGQSAPTLSGGEAQRVKLAAELARPNSGRTLYLLDEPTTGLHFDDIAKLLTVLNSLVDLGNTVVVIEHNLDVIKTADWLVDLGPEAGVGGGRIVAEGTPEELVESKGEARREKREAGRFVSHTARLLAPVLESSQRAERASFDIKREAKKRSGDVDVKQVGRDAKMPWQVDGLLWHTEKRLAHNGKPAKWEGGALLSVLAELEMMGGFAEPNFNHKSVVEVLGQSKQGGWFLHAKTGQEWFLMLTFRVKKNYFTEASLARKIDLPPADELEDLPVYGPDPRLWVKNIRGPWQEVTFKVHWQEEVETKAFKNFLKEAKRAFLAQAEQTKLDLTELAPWKVLGRKWHTSQKGLANGANANQPELTDELCTLIEASGSGLDVDWSGKTKVIYRKGGKVAAELFPKRKGGVRLHLPVESGSVPLGTVAELGRKPEVTAGAKGDVVKLRFTSRAQVSSAKLRSFLAERLS